MAEPLSRRTPGGVPHISMLTWEQARPLLERFLLEQQGRYEALPAPHASTHMGGDDTVEGTSTPTAITAGQAGSVGDPTAGFAPIGHVHGTTGLTIEGLTEASTTPANGENVLAVHDPEAFRLLQWIVWQLGKLGLSFNDGASVEFSASEAQEGIDLSAEVVGAPTTKGDIWTFSTTPTRKAAGTTGTALVYDVGEADGLRASMPWKGMRTKTLVNNTLTDILRVPITPGISIAGILRYHAIANNGTTVVRSEIGFLGFFAAEKGDGSGVAISDGVVSPLTDGASADSITVTTLVAVDTAADTVTLRVNVNGVTADAVEFRYVLDSLDAQTVTFL